ncbi:MAG TPA: MotA/TolQ/ExbB proton channel family protein [Elusimicrobiota bacterium]|nr:MotA/TolQ/ExbB proton channel family protein [Elusimicrobiota bacterium]
MEFHVGLKEIIVSGGVTLVFLIFLSIYSLALIWERWRYFDTAIKGTQEFLEKIRKFVAARDFSEAMSACRRHQGLAQDVVMASLVGASARDERKRGAERASERAQALLQKRLSTLGTIASVAPFIGLFGTVVGVMRAFRDLASVAGAGPGVVAIGISEALVCTATGLFVAIPAVAAYNYFNSRTESFAEEMDWISDEILDSLSDKAHKVS